MSGGISKLAEPSLMAILHIALEELSNVQDQEYNTNQLGWDNS
jgi:hypothetical protein